MVNRKKYLLTLFLGVLVGIFSPVRGWGHPLAPSLLKITESSPGHGIVTWKTPLQAVPGGRLLPVMPEDCMMVGVSDKRIEGRVYTQSWQIHCGGSLIGRSFRVDGIGESKADVILRVALADGRLLNTVLSAGHPDFRVPEREPPWTLGQAYLVLGFEHILTGLDHLLFVLGLVLLVSDRRQLFWTVTAFTVGHSLTLTLAVLGVVHIPSSPVEALIAFSIIVLALELTRRGNNTPDFFRRRPWVMALAFGSLHGLGFAGALTEVGLPAGDIPLALFSFNLGIEAGQLLFIALILTVGAVGRVFSFQFNRRAYRMIAYGIGSLSAFWFLQRITGLW